MAKKQELIDSLINDYGYTKEDLKDESGKPFTNGQLEMMIQQEMLDAQELQKSKTEQVDTRRKIKDDEMIMVMNGLDGSLTHRSQSTGRVWRFTEFGQTDKLPYIELLTLRNQSPKVFNEGWLVILDKQIQEDFKLVEIYKNILTPNNIDAIFDKDIDEMRTFINALPTGMKTTFISKARSLYMSGKLDSISKINYIQKEFGISLEDNAPLSDTL